MAIDVTRVVQAALEAATQGQSPDDDAKRRKPHLSAGRALMIGAGLVTIGRLAAPKGRDALDLLQQRLGESDSEPEDELQETEDEYDEEPEGEGEEDFDEEEDEYDEEPEGEVEEDFDDEEGEDENERPRPRRGTKARARSHS
jgi:hypothetical protein